MNRVIYALSDLTIGRSCRLAFRMRIAGRDNVPARGPVILAANHGSYLDPPLVGTAAPRPVHFVARESLAKIPVIGWWMRRMGVVFVHRDAPTRVSMERSVEVLARGGVLGVFPEGTRTRTGRTGPFRRGILLLAKKTGAAVVPTGIRGSFRAFPPGRRLPRLRRCEVRFGIPMSAEELLAEGGLGELRRRVVALSETGGGEAESSDLRAGSRCPGPPSEPSRGSAAEPPCPQPEDPAVASTHRGPERPAR